MLYYNKKKSLIQAREEQKAVDFSLVLRERHRGENVLILQSYIKPAFTDVQSNFADINLRAQLNFLSLSNLAYVALNFLLRGTHREYSSKPLKHSIVKRFLVYRHIFIR